MSKSSKGKAVFIVLMACITLLSSAAMAQKAGALSDEQVKERLNYIQTNLDGGQAGAQAWWYGWMGGYTVLTGAQLGIAFSTSEKETKQDMLVGGITSGLGLAGKLITPFTPAYAPSRLRAMPGDTPEERRAKLAEAENYLKRSSEVEYDGRGWFNQTLNFVVNAGAAVFLCAYFKRPYEDGMFTFIVGMAISEVDIISQPMRATRDWKAYRAKYYGEEKAALPENNWFVTVLPMGFAAGFHF